MYYRKERGRRNEIKWQLRREFDLLIPRAFSLTAPRRSTYSAELDDSIEVSEAIAYDCER